MEKFKILFVENRYKTYFWESIAKNLVQDGHEVSWIIQNHTFTPNTENVYKVPYPSKIQPKNTYNVQTLFDFIKTTDRIVNYFNGTTEHYSYYYENFTDIIKKVNPDLIIGESTLFHELMIIDICKKNNILYLHPSSTSYPVGRFSFFTYDTKEPCHGSNETLSDNECDKLISNISERKIIPDYMKKIQITDSTYPRVGSLQDKWIIISSFLKGEIYNTPSPIRKISQDLQVKRILKQWNQLAKSRDKDLPNQNIVLYPLQMQPEANLDVWGNKFKNQSKLIKELSENLPKNWSLVIKTNPKSKYEMNKELLEVVKNHTNIIPLHSTTAMHEIFQKSDIVITVTGTVAIECILTEKPLGLLGPSVVEDINGYIKMNSADEISSIVSTIENSNFQKPSLNDKRNLIKKLLSSSHKGLITDPISNPNCLQKENINLVTHAILRNLRRTS